VPFIELFENRIREKACDRAAKAMPRNGKMRAKLLINKYLTRKSFKLKDLAEISS